MRGLPGMKGSNVSTIVITVMIKLMWCIQGTTGPRGDDGETGPPGLRGTTGKMVIIIILINLHVHLCIHIVLRDFKV